jgi:hypothetical protein
MRLPSRQPYSVKVLEKAGLDLEDWDHPAVVKVLFDVAKPFFQSTGTDDRDPADVLMMTLPMTVTVALMTESLCLL